MKKAARFIFPTYLLYTIAVIEGMTVMGLELMAAQMMAPFYGASLLVWSMVIGFTIGGLTLGYFVGGMLSERKAATNLLTLMIAGLLLLMVGMNYWSSGMIGFTLDMGLAGGLFTACLLLFLLPFVVLGMFPPVLIQAATSTREKAGKTAGNIFTLSTVGGIASAFLFGFFLIPTVGVTNSAYMLADLLCLLLLIVLFHRPDLKGLKKAAYAVGPVLLLVLVSMTEANRGAHPPKGPLKTVYESEGLLGKMTVIDDPNQVRVLNVNNISQSRMQVGGRSLWSYVYQLATYCSVKPQGAKVLLGGMGGGNLVFELNQLGFEVTAVDIDPRMGKVATDYFNMPANTKIVADDIRHYVNQVDQPSFDIVIFDLSQSEGVPSNVYTQENFKHVREILHPGGMVLIHYLGLLSNENATKALQSVGKTLQASGFEVQLINTRPKNDQISQMIFVASEASLQLENANYRIAPEITQNLKIPTRENLYLPFNFSDGMVLQDNYPVLEHLQQEAILSIRKSNIEGYIKLVSSQH